MKPERKINKKNKKKLLEALQMFDLCNNYSAFEKWVLPALKAGIEGLYFKHVMNTWFVMEYEDDEVAWGSSIMDAGREALVKILGVNREVV